MSRLRWTLVALLVISTALFAAGALAERSDADEHTGVLSVHTEESDEGGTPDERVEKDETLLGIDPESTPLVVLAVVLGLALAVLAATHLAEVTGVLTAIALIAVVWAVLDVREVLHQADESRTGVALLAAIVAVLHLATAAIAGRLASLARRADIGAPGRPGTMRA